MQVRIELKDKKNSSGRIRDGEIVLYISSRLPLSEQQRHAEILARRLLAQQALVAARPVGPAFTPALFLGEADLAAWCKELNHKHFGFTNLADCRYREMRTRWGSCTCRAGRIRIARRLATAPRHLLEYVLIHELAHLKEANHGPHFWALVAKACPDYQARRKELRAFGAWLDRKEQPPVL